MAVWSPRVLPGSCFSSCPDTRECAPPPGQRRSPPPVPRSGPPSATCRGGLHRPIGESDASRRPSGLVSPLT
eukprot:681886-Prorocentrum_minimum.AAC.1